MLPKIDVEPRKLYTGTKGLPPLPEVVTKIQEMIRKDSVDLKKVTDMVTSDVALVTQILKIVNSAYYGLTREVTNLRFAIAYLGINEIYRIVMSLSVVASFDIKNKSDLKSFWHHSFYTALCTKKLARVYARLEESEDLWSCSLLHDVGKLVYLHFFPDHYHAIRELAQEKGVLFSEAEKMLDLPASSYLGAELAEYWQLPSAIKKACQYHTLEDLENLDMSLPNAEFRRIICLGNLFSQLVSSNLNDQVRERIIGAIKSKTNCSDDEFITLLADVQSLQFEVDEFVRQVI
jgi:HD-like signal output (HDOD) protein